MATSKIFEDIQNVNISQYADDFVIYKSNKNIDIAVSEIQSALDVFSKDIEEIGLDISHKKTKVCIFSRGKLRTYLNLNLTSNNHKIQQVDSAKYLGIWLDRSLRWGKHINEAKDKTLKFLNILKVLAGSKWGVHPKHLRRLYISIIRSRLDYGSFLYDNSINSHLNKLEKVQNQAMRVIGGFIRTTPIHVMQGELCLQPLFIRQKFLAGKFWLRSRLFEDNITINVLNLLNVMSNHMYWRNKKLPLLITVHKNLTQHPIVSTKKLKIHCLPTWISNYNMSSHVSTTIEGLNSSKKKCSRLTMINCCQILLSNKYNSFYKLYTDGSKDVSGSGAAVFDPQADISMKFKIESDNITIMHTELIAISESLSYVLSREGSKFVILSDSKSALLHLARLTSNIRGYPIAYDILDSISKIQNQNKSLIIQWIPSHIGIMGNEEADAAAKQAISCGIPYKCVPLQNEILIKFKQECRLDWQEYFDIRSRIKGIWYKTIVCQLPRCPWFDGSKVKRADIVKLVRLRSGHIPSNKFKYMMRRSPTENCLDCGNVHIDDVFHLLMECVRNETERPRLLKGNYSVGMCNSLLAAPLSKEARALIKMN